MTQEEKAKAYDEALERARKLYESYNRLVLSTDEIERIFPELAESEDERMYARVTGRYTRFEKYYLRALGETEANKVLKQCEEEELWIKNLLEKQKESLHIQETCKENPNSFTNEDERIRKGMIDEIKAILRGEDLGFPPQDVLESRLAYLEKQKEQKPAEWSEEDEKNLKSVVSTLWFALNTPHFPLNYERIVELETWLESLKNRGNSPKSNTNSLWKPSEEQMEWLESAVILSIDKPRIHGIIISLYEQLKRLSL